MAIHIRYLMKDVFLRIYSRRALLLLLGLWLLFLGFQLCKAYHTPIWRDDALFAQVAKNLVLGKGYSLTSFDTLVPFATGISSGPAVILPAALMIKLFGNIYWVPGLASIMLINILLLIAYYQLIPLISSATTRQQCAGLFLLFSILLTNHDTGFPAEFMHVWHALMGEVPSALCVIIAALYIGKNRFNPRILFLSGLWAGLGTLCKLQALIGVSALGAYLALSYFLVRAKESLTLSRILTNLFSYIIGALLPLLAFECIKTVSLGSWHEYSAHVNSMKAAIDTSSTFSLPSFLEKIYLLGEYAGIIHFPLEGFILYTTFLIVMIAALLRILQLSIKRTIKYIATENSLLWTSNALIVCCAAHLLWWALICSALMPRYTLQGILYGCAAAALSISVATLATPRKAKKILITIALVVICFRYDAVAYLFSATEYNTSLPEQKEALHKLIEIKQQVPNTVFFSCGYTFEMEYLLPESQNFVKCERLEEPNFQSKNKVLVSFTFENSGKLIFGEPGGFGLVLRDNADIANKHCPTPNLYAGNNYYIASCSP